MFALQGDLGDLTSETSGRVGGCLPASMSLGELFEAGNPPLGDPSPFRIV